jgi:hypothetical protein
VLKPTSGALKSATVPFQVANTASLLAGTYAAFDNIAAYTSVSGYFIWGLPFFFGRSVYTALSGSQAGPQSGPFVAF